MKALDICYPCLCRLVKQAAGLATDDESLRAEAERAGLKIVDDNFSPEVLTLEIATKIHRAVKEITSNPEPYRRMKDEEMRLSRELIGELLSFYPNNFKGYLALSTLGNSIDFFRGLDDIRKDMQTPLTFLVDESDKFKEKLSEAKSVLFLADNAGEVYFDLPLVQYLERYALVTYVVKESPIQNDVTREDVRLAGLDGQLGCVITTGQATPGVIFASASEEFKSAYMDADLVLAKGMGYYEGLSELSPDGRVLHCTMAKCQPVADSLGVPLNSYVAMFR
jgi:uncharacterized protein with ATP-grasp and redox domains